VEEVTVTDNKDMLRSATNSTRRTKVSKTIILKALICQGELVIGPDISSLSVVVTSSTVAGFGIL
jgi:hypothetical protein